MKGHGSTADRIQFREHVRGIKIKSKIEVPIAFPEGAAMARRVAVYARVSTTRQAEQDLSLPDQLSQAGAFCLGKGWQVVEQFVEPGASATEDRRPEFQKLIDWATGLDRPVDVVLVHSMSRFFRDQFQSEFLHPQAAQGRRGGRLHHPGLERCGSCDSGMTIRTGKSGRYRYYTCAGCAQKGKTFCTGRSINMDALDGMVIEHLTDRLFQPERLKTILEAYVERSSTAQADRQRKLATAKQRQTEISGKLGRLLQLVANGVMDNDDPDLAEQLQALKAQRHHINQEIILLQQSSSAGASAITSERLVRFADAMRNAMASGDFNFRKAYLRLCVDTITVSNAEVAITGPKAALAKACALDDLPPAAAVVPSFVRAWRAKRCESNNWNYMKSFNLAKRTGIM